MKKISRRQFIKQSSALAVAAGYSAILEKGFPYIRNNKIANKAIVIGMDGMDPKLIKRFMAEGIMPNFKKAIEQGLHFGNLESTNPPQSPVAWASFINGTNPGKTGIFDFVHRDPVKFEPFMSTSRSYDANKNFTWGDWNIPLSSGKVELERHGKPFWSYLTEQDIPATVFQIPANFPIDPGAVKAISGMGTPDLLGSYGTATLFTDRFFPDADKLAGGRVIRVRSFNNKIEAALPGPKNSFKVDAKASEVPLVINRDAYESVIRIKLQNQEIILRQGDWSDWVPLKFEMLPYVVSVPGMVRFYAKQVRPNFELYVSPINVDPIDPTLPISSPADYSQELANAIGRFYTQGFPADTKSLTNKFLNDDEYLYQAKIVLEENLKALDYQFNKFNEGLFYFYFSNTDQNQHMLTRLMDETHPLYNPKASTETKNGVRFFYQAMDKVLAQVLSKVDSKTFFMALSDHGFASFKREFNLSTWLVENGFTAVTDKKKMHDTEFYAAVNWEKTDAYALGLNGIYINLKGREKNGVIDGSKVQAIKNSIKEKLPKAIDPKTGERAVLEVYDSKEIYSGKYMALAPDLIVGYNNNYRISDNSVLGKFPKEIISDRTDPWAADHCLDPSVVPGMVLCNRKLSQNNPGLWDMAPSILNAFGISTPKNMDGKVVFI